MTSRLFCFVLVVTFMVAVERQAYAIITVWSDFPVEIRVNGVDHKVRIPAFVASYDNGDDCGSANHKTSHGRCFAHLHVHAPIPTQGIDKDDNIWDVTHDNMKVYWDNQYNRLYGSTPDPAYNCWSYAFGQNVIGGYYDIWIQDPTYIYEDDYHTTVNPVARNVIKEPGHAISVYDAAYYDPRYPGGFVLGTYEKNRSSGLYLKVYYLWSTSPPYPPYPYGNTIFYKKNP